VRPEVDQLTGGACPRRTIGAWRCGVPHGEAVLEVVLVRQPASSVLPGPLVDIERILGPAAREDAAVRIRLGVPGHRRGAAGHCPWLPGPGGDGSSSAEPTPLWARSRCHARPTSCVPAWE